MGASEVLGLSLMRTPVRRAGEGPPVLVLEGANNIEGWLPLFDRLANKHEVILPTHPGFDGGGPVEWLDSVADLANFYLDFLDERDLSGVHLVGLSLGGWVAAELAVRNTNRLASLTLVSSLGIYLPGCEPLDIFLRSEEQSISDLFHSAELADRVKVQALAPESEDRRLHNRVTTAKLTWEPRFYDPDLRKWLHRIKLPTTIVWGAEDRVLPVAYAQEWRRLIGGAELHVLPDCGHAPQIEAEEPLANIIETFVSKTGRRS